MPPVPAVDADEETIRDWLALLTDKACVARGFNEALAGEPVSPPTTEPDAISEVRFVPEEPLSVN